MSKERGTHDYVEDIRNLEVLVYINDKFYPRQDASISVFDSGYLLGDGVWEGIRYHNGKFIFLEQHLERLFWGASQIDMDIGKTIDEVTTILYDTVKENKMEIIGLIAAVFIALQTVTYIPKVSVSAEIKQHEVVESTE